MASSTRYDEDIAAWAEEQAALIRAGQLSRLDLANIAEEIAPLGHRRHPGRQLPARMSEDAPPDPQRSLELELEGLMARKREASDPALGLSGSRQSALSRRDIVRPVTD
jgi:hypothetical protein